jgi:hypothetical protein
MQITKYPLLSFAVNIFKKRNLSHDITIEPSIIDDKESSSICFDFDEYTNKT